MATKANGCSDAKVKAELLSMMRSIAHSCDIETMETAITVLKESEYWNEKKQFSEYFSRYYLSIKEVI